MVLEDSPNGVAGARAAGMAVVAVPGPMTRGLDFTAADLVVPSLAAVDLATLGSVVCSPRIAAVRDDDRRCRGGDRRRVSRVLDCQTLVSAVGGTAHTAGTEGAPR